MFCDSYDRGVKFRLFLQATFQSLCRGAALFLGFFVGVNLLASLVGAGFDPNVWWIDLRWAPEAGRKIGFIVFAAAMFSYAAGAAFSWGRVARGVIELVIGSVALVLVVNTIEFYVLVGRGNVSSAWLAPVTLMIAIILVAMLATLIRPPTASVRMSRVLAGATVFAAAFALLQMVAFGKTDYSRRSDVAVVLGARVYADGKLSDALMDRVTTSCRLYRDGYVRKLVFSGGPGDGKVHETEAMKRIALQRGVPESAIILDYGGLNTRSTAQNTAKIFKENGVHRAIVVSHFYHLPRVKLAYQQEGWDVFTVPARSDRVLLKLPIFMGREGVAMVKYYFDPLAWALPSGAKNIKAL
jgi:vancomycin permeability regulator SanA